MEETNERNRGYGVIVSGYENGVALIVRAVIFAR